jgi:nucleoside-diphosphate-sugar epimerase
MKVLIAGSHGMAGSAVVRHLSECGYEVFRLVKHSAGPREVWWDPDAGQIDRTGLEDFDEARAESYE